MAAPTQAPGVGALLDALSFSADELVEAKQLLRTSRAARREVEQVARQVPEGATGKDALQRATALYLLSRPEKAQQALEGAEERNQTVLLRGRIALELGDPAGAANAFASLVGSSVDGRTLLLDLATAAALSGDTALAHKAATKIPEGADALYAEGIALESDGEYEDARKKYEAALKRDPTHARALFRLAQRLDLEGEDARAIEVYRRLVALPGTYVNALVNLGLLYEDQGRHAEAEQCYRRVLEADPTHVRARIGLKDVVASQTMFFDEDHERREDRRAQILRTPISEFELSVRSRNCLSKMDIDTLGDLVRKSETELLAYKNFGETSLQEIKDILAQKGLSLGMNLSLADEAPLYASSRAEAEADLDALFGPVAKDEDADLEDVGERDPAEIPIEALDLSIRARRCMESLDIRTLGDLLARTENDLKTAKNFGQTSLNEVRERLEQLGYELRKR